MKVIETQGMKMIKAGKTCNLPGPIKVNMLLQNMERNESYIYWMQPSEGGVEDQLACINVNGEYYQLNSKLEKAIFRNVRLTRGFTNCETLADGTKKLKIPQRLMKEKIRTSVHAYRFLASEVRIPVCGEVCHKCIDQIATNALIKWPGIDQIVCFCI